MTHVEVIGFFSLLPVIGIILITTWIRHEKIRRKLLTKGYKVHGTVLKCTAVRNESGIPIFYKIQMEVKWEGKCYKCKVVGGNLYPILSPSSILVYFRPEFKKWVAIKDQKPNYNTPLYALGPIFLAIGIALNILYILYSMGLIT